MKTTTTFLLLLIALVAPGCRSRHSGAQGAVKTETIAPAAPEPAAGPTDSITTQTVDVEDSRSVAEGGDTAAADNTTTTAVKKKKSGAAATSRKAPRPQSRPAGRTQ